MSKHRASQRWPIVAAALSVSAGVVAGIITVSVAGDAAAPERPVASTVVPTAPKPVPAPVAVQPPVVASPPTTVAPPPAVAPPAPAAKTVPVTPRATPKVTVSAPKAASARRQAATQVAPAELPISDQPQLPPTMSKTFPNGVTVTCSGYNVYPHDDGSCSDKLGDTTAAAPASNPCSGTGTECLNGISGIDNPIPGLMGGR
jgi:hypothetical protein